MNTPHRHIPGKNISILAGLLLIGIFLRLFHISQPFIDFWSWRQSDVAMIARNFYEHGFNILYPQIDWAGTAPGYVGTEFPLIPFLASLIYLITGVHEWVGRLLSVVFFVISVPFFYLIVRQVYNEKSALFAVGFYVVSPLSVFAGRSFMPDMPTLSLSLVALYLFSKWLEDEDNLGLFLSASMTTSMAILVKLPAIIIGVPFLYLSWVKYKRTCVTTKRLWLFAFVTLLPPLAWYCHAYLIALSNPPFHFFGESGIKLMGLAFYWSVIKWTFFYYGEHPISGITPIISVLMAIGLVLRPHRRGALIFHWWLLAMVLFIVLAGWGNRHPWYQLPIVPIAAAFAGKAWDFGLKKISRMNSSKVIPLMATIALYAAVIYLSYIYSLTRYGPWNLPSWKAGIAVQEIAPVDALILVPGKGEPTTFYYSHRRGWHFYSPSDSEQAIFELEQRRKEGAQYLIFNKYWSWWLDHYKDFREHLDSHYSRVREEEDYIIFDLAD